MDQDGTSMTTHRIEVTGPLDRRDVEILQLEIRRLAKLNGVDVMSAKIELVCDESPDSP